MYKRWLIGTVLMASALTGCTAAKQIASKDEFDLTVLEDRLQWKEDGLEFQSTVGPYAVYRITHEDPRLIGPYVRSQNGYAMLCNATKYFAKAAVTQQVAAMKLLGGVSGQVPYVTASQGAAEFGGCVPPMDSYGTPVPPSGGGSNPPGTVPPNGSYPPGSQPTPPNTNPPGGNLPPPSDYVPPAGMVPPGGFQPPDFPPDGGAGSGGDVILQMGVSLSDAPPTGSVVLIRRVALTSAVQHNASHVLPQICCVEGSCTLGDTIY
jgi:hypothetical protein